MSAIVAAVSRVVRQPPSARVQKSASSDRWSRRSGSWRERTCSQKRSSPVGSSTRRISASVAAGSGTVQRTPIETTASKLPSSAGSASAVPLTTSIGTAVARARSAATAVRSDRVRPQRAGSRSSGSARTSARRRSRPRAPVRAIHQEPPPQLARDRVGPLPLPALKVAGKARLVRAVQPRTGLPPLASRLGHPPRIRRLHGHDRPQTRFGSRSTSGLCSTPCRRTFVSLGVVPCRYVPSGAVGTRSDSVLVTFGVGS